MKNRLTHSLKQSLRYSKNQIQSLQILSMNVARLEEYIETIAENNPLIEFDHSIKQSIPLNEDIAIISEISLPSFLCNQLKLIPHHPLCELLIYELNSNGYFQKNYDQLLLDYHTTTKDLDCAIAILQSLEPFGIASFSLKQCLQNQIKFCDYDEKEVAFSMLEYLPEIANRDLQSIVEKSGYCMDAISRSVDFIKTLNPKPAANFSAGSQILLPDIIIETGEEIQIQIHNISERIHFVDEYKNQKELKVFYDLNQKIQQQIQLRNQTLVLTINAIIEFQYDYFLLNKALKPMRLKDISNLTHLHVSTISRAVQNKVISLNQRLILLKSLFVKSVHQISKDYIKERIKKITESEIKALSDKEIMTILKQEGIQIARRTVNQYRKQLKIQSSYQRNTKDL